MIRLEEVQRRHRSGDVETTALDGVSLEIARGEFVSIMGPSGCGKSSLLNVLGTIDRPDGGAYWFDGRDLSGLDETALARFRASTLGFVFQSFNLIDELTVAQNVELGLVYDRADGKNRKARTKAALERFGISHRANHYPHQLSGGQGQRASIARAVIGAPELLLADEPTGNLDAENGRQVMDILTSLNQGGTTIVMVTHAPDHAARAGRQIGMLDGRLVAAPADGARP